MKRHHLAPLLLPLVASGCITHLGEEATRQGDLVRDCLVPDPAATRLGAPIPLAFPDRTLWLFPESTIAGARHTAVAAALAPGADPCAAPPVLLTDPGGAPRHLLPPTDAERADDAARADGRHHDLLPLAGLVLGDRGYLFFALRRIGEGLSAVDLGVGLCTLGPEAAPCARLPGPGGASTLLMPAASRPAALIADGGVVHVLSCAAPAAFEQVCVLARVPEAQLASPSAWEYAALDGWRSDPAQAVAVTHDLGILSLRRAPGDAGPALVTADPFAHAVHARVAGSWGQPFGDRRPLFDLAPPAGDDLLGGGRLDPGATRDDERALAITYTTSNPGSAGLHLATFSLRGALR